MKKVYIIPTIGIYFFEQEFQLLAGSPAAKTEPSIEDFEPEPDEELEG